MAESELSAVSYFDGRFRNKAIELIRFSASIRRTQAQRNQRSAEEVGAMAERPRPKEVRHPRLEPIGPTGEALLLEMQTTGASQRALAAKYGLPKSTVYDRVAQARELLAGEPIGVGGAEK